jgi:hypothetical protein
MAGETNLDRLLSTMSPVLNDGAYVFTIVDTGIPAGLSPVVTVREKEGLTLVLGKEEADSAGLEYDYVAAWITLEVHSALDAVGLTAAVSSVLKDAGISCNVVAGFTHDHLFVPADKAQQALAALGTLSQRL